jgi:hypothetical protein
MKLLFSRRTIFAAIDVLEARSSQAEIGALFLDFGPDVYTKIRGENVGAKKRMNDLKRFVDANPQHPVDGGLLENMLVERAATHLPSEDHEYLWANTPALKRLKHTLAQDNFIVTGGQLRRELPTDIGLPEAESDLMRLLNQHGLTVAKGHLEQAFDNHTKGNWAAANSQIRAFLEGLFDDLAVKIDPSASVKKSGQDRRAHLASVNPPLFDRTLNEWGDNGVGLVNGLMARLHPQGAHPGLSDEDDSTFRLHLVLLTARLFLARYDKRVP